MTLCRMTASHAPDSTRPAMARPFPRWPRLLAWTSPAMLKTTLSGTALTKAWPARSPRPRSRWYRSTAARHAAGAPDTQRLGGRAETGRSPPPAKPGAPKPGSLSSFSQSCHPGGAGGQAWSGCQPAGGTKPTGSGHFGGGLKRSPMTPRPLVHSGQVLRLGADWLSPMTTSSSRCFQATAGKCPGFAATIMTRQITRRSTPPDGASNPGGLRFSCRGRSGSAAPAPIRWAA